MSAKVSSLDHLVLTVRSLDETIAFYRDVLGMEDRSFQGTDGSFRHALFFGSQKINLHQAGSEFSPHAAAPTTGSADLCFLSPTDLTDWQDHLKACGIAIEDGPVARSGATGPITSLYIRDPDGVLIEISNAAA